MATIYRKTDKGRSEIETRAHRLSRRLRSALILVDGHRNADELARMIVQQPAETLAALQADGFIELIARPAPAPIPAAAPTPPGAPDAMPFVTQRRDAVRALNDAVGPAGEALATRMEQARDPRALLPLLDVARQVIQNARGSAAAAAFAERFIR